MKFTFHGLRYRVQLTVHDATGPTVPHELRRDKPTFAVEVLPQSANPNTAYSTGKLVYHDSDIRQAWTLVSGWVGGKIEYPKQLRRYWPNEDVNNAGA